jgi:hypothetical protein
MQASGQQDRTADHVTFTPRFSCFLSGAVQQLVGNVRQRN